MRVNVYCDDALVFTGPVSGWLDDNDNDEWLTALCEKLHVTPTMTFRELSGTWTVLAIGGSE